MTSIAEDALKAVPDRYREAAESLGATRWEVIYKTVLPAARNGLLQRRNDGGGGGNGVSGGLGKRRVTAASGHGDPKLIRGGQQGSGPGADHTLG